MRLRIGRPHTAIIVAPHPDDEIIGAAGLIRLLVRRGTQVRVVIVSDGAASHPNSRAWPPARLIATRRQESRRALHRLGVTAGAISFLGLPDGRLSAMGERDRRVLRRAIRLSSRPGLLVGPAADDAHPDHRRVAAILATAPGGWRRLAYRIWPPHRVVGGAAVYVAGQGGHATKRSLIGLYRTQMGAVRDDPAGFAIAPHELAVFAHPVERFVEIRR